MAYTSNGTTLDFGGAVSDVRSITFSDSGTPIDITDLSSTNHEYETGLSDPECTVELVGGTTIAVGDTGTVTVDWADAVTDSTMTDGIVTNVEISGSLDSEITSSVTFKPTPAA